ncbi:helix-turn-helix domain-containing protein [Roseiterribacter gracilis]|uniref:Transcriptional regulator n=1 Tax=Roseiterribacter gracilis TaxID=2812848 RepID=A0A8S8XIE0_9PROT|nr:transcriptional regulator [Rhodospirillales bacterium TMPK1]
MTSEVINADVNMATRTTHPPIGILLREWRIARRISQMELALQSDISSRHLSCIETGKAQASRETVERLADVLAMPLRERNALLIAAGYAPVYAESTLGTPALDRMRQVIDLVLGHQEPYPAFVLDRHWETLLVNDGARRVDQFVMGGRALKHTNMLHQVFDPDDFRRVIVNWQDMAWRFLRRLHEEIADVPTDEKAQSLLEELLRYPDVPKNWRFRDVEIEPSPVHLTVLRSPEGELRFFDTITTFAGPRDVTLSELRIQCAFPADDRTAAICKALAAEGGSLLSIQK